MITEETIISINNKAKANNIKTDFATAFCTAISLGIQERGYPLIDEKSATAIIKTYAAHILKILNRSTDPEAYREFTDMDFEELIADQETNDIVTEISGTEPINHKHMLAYKVAAIYTVSVFERIAVGTLYELFKDEIKDITLT